LAIRIVGRTAHWIVRYEIEHELFSSIVDDLMRFSGFENDCIPCFDRSQSFFMPNLTSAGYDVIELPLCALRMIGPVSLIRWDAHDRNVALLAKNGAPSGPAIRGRAVADYVVVRASDGYRAVFPLCELDPRITDKIVLLADKRNGSPMGSDLGPFRVVVPDEKHQMRWVRNVTEIAVSTAM
jgi:hypothetical protein